MGSLKKKKQGLGEDRQPCDITNNEGISGLDDTAATEECQEPTTLEDCQPKLHVDASYVDNTEKTLKSKDQGPSVGFCESSDPSVSEPLKDCAQPVNLQTVVMQNEAMVSTNIRGKGDDEGENIALDKGKGKDLENIFVPVPTTPGPSDPRSPTPFGQQHMRTQVSLEVVQCCSAATSPMTPPEGEHSFFFPSTFGKQGTGPADSAASTKDAKLHVGQQVDFCSVATSPMTPKTPSYTAFPALVGKGMGQQEEKMKNKADQIARDEKGRCTTSKCLGEVSQKDEYLKCASSNEMSKGSSSNRSVGSSTGGLTTAVTQAQVTVEDRVQQCKQQRMGSMDQDITILVTQHGNNEDAGEEKDETLEVEMVKIEEIKKARENTRNIETVEKITSTVALDHAQEKSSPKQPQKRPENPNVCNKADNSEAIAQNNVQLELTDVSLPKSPVPESPAPFGCHNIRTQVSLEVVQCQSVATSPMTPPEGTQAFYFPIFLGKCKDMGTETKDTELQVGQQVEFRSVATAPMTPRTPVATTFPEIQKQVSIEEKIQEEREEENKERVIENKKEILKEEEKLTQKESVKEDGKEVVNCNEKDEEKGEEPVTEVSWDEKGMTWEVYGAVVEVAVLGSAIQKHLEKQVKKQKQLSSMPPPPPLSPSASPLTSEPSCGGSGKRRGRKKGEHDGKVIRRRRNPFRLLMENVQQPHCCSKANTTE